MLDAFYVSAFWLFKLFVTKLPKSLLRILIHTFATIGYLIDAKHNKIAKVNLDLAFEDRMSDKQKTEIIKQCYQNLLYLLREFIVNQTISKENLLKKITFHNEHIYEDAIQKKQGVIFLTAHYGSWELLSLAMGAKFGPMSIIGRKLDSVAMNAILEKNRQRFNITLLEKKGAMRGMLKALQKGENVGLLVDQNTAEQEGILISFFGKSARHTPAAAQFSKKMNVTIIPTFITTNDYEHFDITLYEPILPPQNDDEKAIIDSVQAQANITQQVIEQKPDEWFWFHRRWKNQYEELYK
ncbi:lipid A biosynthesis lauroyl acyltransferase [Sulfurospirillum arsenophilum]|uniref:lipid A biosynthesis lauroyl acyltransferase n=1 Tax=Sulfurospirillum arsenophilum TaxID=56698 RepID=UPI0005A91606|nr:lipid A biosynthesis lauroyl acyltransferase [Sulfurospirillum arsenophilum]